MGPNTGTDRLPQRQIEVERPRARGVDGREIMIPSWEAAAQEDWLGRWAMNLMPINVSTRRFGRAVRLPEGDVPAPPGSGVSKSAASRRFVALSAARLADFMAADLSAHDLLVVHCCHICLSKCNIGAMYYHRTIADRFTYRAGAIPRFRKRRYRARHSYWRTRGCIMVGPVRFCP